MIHNGWDRDLLLMPMDDRTVDLMLQYSVQLVRCEPTTRITEFRSVNTRASGNGILHDVVCEPPAIDVSYIDGFDARPLRNRAMNHLYLRAFHAVASEGSFTRAAQVQRVNQSTLSSQVKALEEAYGVRLLDRRGRNVVPTDVGESTLSLTREVFRIQDESATVLDQSKRLQAGRLKVGADGPRHIMPVLDDFMRQHPNVVVSLTTGNARKVLLDLLNYETDVAIVASPKARETQLHIVPFCTYPLVVYVPHDHAWSRRKSIELADFAKERLIVRAGIDDAEAPVPRPATREGAARGPHRDR